MSIVFLNFIKSIINILKKEEINGTYCYYQETGFQKDRRLISVLLTQNIIL